MCKGSHYLLSYQFEKNTNNKKNIDMLPLIFCFLLLCCLNRLCLCSKVMTPLNSQIEFENVCMQLILT